MSGRDVSVFVFPHGSIDDVWKSEDVNSQGVTEYHSEITCEPLPANTTLYMPNILGKPYHLKTKNLEDLIRDKTNEWIRSSGLFSEYIASVLDEYESQERNTMFELMDECDRSDAVGYARQQKMPDEQREQRVKLRTSMEYKTGIKWLKPDYYIVQKRCNLPKDYRPGEGLIICIEEENKQIRKYYSTGNEIHGRYNLTELLTSLKGWMRLGLKPEDKICVFDFVCNIPNFVSNPNKIAKTYDDVELLSFNHDHDGGATMTYGAIPISQSCRDKTVRGGVSFDDTPLSPLTLANDSQSPSSSLSASASPARPLPLFYVKVPPAGIKLINFEVLKHKDARPRSASPFPDIHATPPIDFVGQSVSPSRGDSLGGGKRKHTKRKRSLKRSNRKRRVTRRRYNKKKR
jgi:hypothetical protein